MSIQYTTYVNREVAISMIKNRLDDLSNDQIGDIFEIMMADKFRNFIARNDDGPIDEFDSPWILPWNYRERK